MNGNNVLPNLYVYSLCLDTIPFRRCLMSCSDASWSLMLFRLRDVGSVSLPSLMSLRHIVNGILMRETAYQADHQRFLTIFSRASFVGVAAPEVSSRASSSTPLCDSYKSDQTAAQ